MASTSGIRASGPGSSEYMKKIVLKDSASYGPWRTKVTAILDAEDSLEIVNGTELEPAEIAEVLNADNTSANSVEVDKRQAEIKDWRKRSKKAASLITQTVVIGTLLESFLSTHVFHSHITILPFFIPVICLRVYACTKAMMSSLIAS